MKMSFKGDLDPSAVYQPGDIVRDRGNGYRVRSHSGTWLPVAAPPDRSCEGPPGRDGVDGKAGADGRDGVDGTPGEGFQFRGAWKRRSIYRKNDVATVAGSSFVCVAESTNTKPGVTKAWEPLALRGEDGADGRDGRDGMSHSVVRFRKETVAGPRLSMIFADDAQLGDAVFARADGLAGLAQANAEPNTLAIGLVTANVTAGWPGEIATSGLISGLSGLVPGSVYYLDPDVPGGITSTYPTTIGDYIVVMGVAISPTQIKLEIHWANYIGA